MQKANFPDCFGSALSYPQADAHSLYLAAEGDALFSPLLFFLFSAEEPLSFQSE